MPTKKNLIKSEKNLNKLCCDLDALFRFLDEVYDTIGRKIGAVISGGEIDYDRVSKTILEDIKNERVKGITFDRIG